MREGDRQTEIGVERESGEDNKEKRYRFFFGGGQKARRKR